MSEDEIDSSCAAVLLVGLSGIRTCPIALSVYSDGIGGTLFLNEGAARLLRAQLSEMIESIDPAPEPIQVWVAAEEPADRPVRKPRRGPIRRVRDWLAERRFR